MRSLLRNLAKAFLVYIAISILLILPALNILTPRIVQDALGREFRSEIILFNPFTLKVEIRRAVLLEPNGEVFLSADSALVNLSLSSIWRSGWVFDEVAVTSLYAHVNRMADGSFNFSDLLGEPTVEPQQADAEMPGLTIHRLTLHSRQLKYTDQTHQEPFSTHWNGLTVDVQGLSTVREEGKPYVLDVAEESGGTLHWEGVVSLPGAYSEGTLALEGLSLHPVWRFAQDWLAFDLKGGQLSFSGDYRVEWAQELGYKIADGALAITGINIQPVDPVSLPGTSLGLGAIELSGIEVNGTDETVGVADVAISGVDVRGFSEGDVVSLVTLFEVNLPDSGGAEAEATGEESGWALSLPRVHMSDSQLQWQSPFTSPPLIALSPITVELTNVAWPPVDKTRLDLSLTLNEVTTLAVNGGVSMADGSGALHYVLENLQMALLNANIPAAFNAEISSGDLGAEGDITLIDFAPARVQMNGTSTNFSGIIEDDEQALTSWEAIYWEELDLDLPGRSIAVKELSLNGYSGRLHIYEDGTINAQRVLREEVSEAVEEGTLEEENLRAWTFDIPSIFIADSQLNFMDESLPIDFRTVIGELNGDISGLSNSAQGEIVIDLKGSVDGYAPVVLAGNARPFADKAFLDMGLSFDGVDLVRLTPYSGTYAGYAIDRGILNLNLHYALDGSRLKGDNSIVIKQLKLGEKIDSDVAVDLPLKLALALLTDMNGVIDMDVPITGDVDDPEFGLGSVVFSAVVNLITKAVTAPFALLANLVGSEDDMQRLVFSAGSSTLDEATIAKLTQLSGAMMQRPALNLVLLGTIHPTADRERLQKDLLKLDLQTAGLSAEEVASKGPLWAQAIKARYMASSGSAAQEDVSLSAQYKVVVAGIAVGSAQLQALAEERAVSVKRYLVNELQFPAERAAIELVALDDEKNSFSGVELGIDI